MTLRELLAQAIEFGTLDEPVYVWTTNPITHEYGAYPVTGFKSDNSSTKQEIEVGDTKEK